MAAARFSCADVNVNSMFIFQAVAHGRDPATDPTVLDIYRAYLARRQAVFDAFLKAGR